MSVEEYLSKKPYLENVWKAWNDNCTMSENGSTVPKVEHSTVADEQEVSNCTLQDNDVPNGQAIGTCTVSKTEDSSTMQDNVIGTATLTQDDEMLQDIQESFDVKPRQKLKPSRRSKRLKKKKEKQRQIEARLNLSTSSGTRTTKNSLKTSIQVAAANIVSKLKNYILAQKKYSLKKPDLKKKPHHCPACKQLEKTYKAVIQHLKESHPDYKYRCKYCCKCFNSNSWRYQHQLRHEGLRYKCPEPSCAKWFQFYYQVRDHWKKHSKRKIVYLSKQGLPERIYYKKSSKLSEAWSWHWS